MKELYEIFDYQIEKTKDNEVSWIFHRPYRSTWIFNKESNLLNNREALEYLSEHSGLSVFDVIDVLTNMINRELGPNSPIIYGKGKFKFLSYMERVNLHSKEN